MADKYLIFMGDIMKYKYFLFLLCLILLIICGCSTNGSNIANVVNNENEKLQESTYKNPPNVSISNGVEEVNGVLGPYSWTYCSHNGQTTGVEVSSDAPPNLVQNKEPLKVTSGTAISINFQTPPIRYKVKTWDENIDVTGTYTELDTSILNGRTVIEIFAFWEQGNASYSFFLDIE